VQRDGNDSEFPNLGAARSAVNKTIRWRIRFPPENAAILIASLLGKRSLPAVASHTSQDHV